MQVNNGPDFEFPSEEYGTTITINFDGYSESPHPIKKAEEFKDAVLGATADVIQQNDTITTTQSADETFSNLTISTESSLTTTTTKEIANTTFTNITNATDVCIDNRVLQKGYLSVSHETAYTFLVVMISIFVLIGIVLLVLYIRHRRNRYSPTKGEYKLTGLRTINSNLEDVDDLNADGTSRY